MAAKPNAPAIEPTITPARAPPFNPELPEPPAVPEPLEPLFFSASAFLSSSPGSVALKHGMRVLKSTASTYVMSAQA